MESGRNPFYCEDARVRFLEPESVKLFICHPPYLYGHIEENGGDPKKQMQNVESLEEYQENFVAAMKHMEYALEKNGSMFIAVLNHPTGLSLISKIQEQTSLTLHSIRMWDYSEQFEKGKNYTVLFLHLVKDTYEKDWNTVEDGPMILTNTWDETMHELEGYGDYVITGTSPKGLYKDLIENYSDPGEVVADLFAGSGTVCLVAMELDRKFIYNDVSEDRIIMAKKRIDDAYEAFFGQEELRS